MKGSALMLSLGIVCKQYSPCVFNSRLQFIKNLLKIFSLTSWFFNLFLIGTSLQKECVLYQTNLVQEHQAWLCSTKEKKSLTMNRLKSEGKCVHEAPMEVKPTRILKSRTSSHCKKTHMVCMPECQHIYQNLQIYSTYC